MKIPIIKSHRAKREQVIKIFVSDYFQNTVKFLKRVLMKKFKSYFINDILWAQKHSFMQGVRICCLYHN